MFYCHWTLARRFDRVQHGSLLEKFAQLEIPDEVYNWINSYLEGREHVTKHRESTSGRRKINSSVVQGSSIGPASYSVAESDLKPTSGSFMMDKFADDVDLITMIEHYSEINDGVEHIADWADKNNLVLNKAKTKEIIFCSSRSVQLPPPLDGREQVSSFRKLGVIVQNKLSMKDHVDVVLRDCANQVYRLNILRAHSMQASGLQVDFKSKILSKLLYASSAWWSMTKQEDRQRINSFLARSRRLGFYPADELSFEELCKIADRNLFDVVINNCTHVFYKKLLDIKPTYYCLRKRNHDFSLPDKDDRNFIN